MAIAPPRLRLAAPVLVALLGLLAGCGGDVAAATSEDCCDTEAAETKAAAVAQELEGRNLSGIPDLTLLDQDGKEHRLVTDLIKGRRVIANFVFSTCSTVCPTLQTVFEGVQKRLGDRLGKDVVMLSITVDPDNDTVARMKAFAEDHHAKPGWYFLTGKPENVREVLYAFNAYTAKKEEHTAMFVLGNEPAGKWMYQSGFVEPSVVVRALDLLGKEQ